VFSPAARSELAVPPRPGTDTSVRKFANTNPACSTPTKGNRRLAGAGGELLQQSVRELGQLCSLSRPGANILGLAVADITVLKPWRKIAVAKRWHRRRHLLFKSKRTACRGRALFLFRENAFQPTVQSFPTIHSGERHMLHCNLK